MNDLNITHHLDAKGLFCPEPVMMLHNMIRGMKIGDIVEIQATDPSTKRDFRKFCNFLGQEMLACEDMDGVYRFLICKQEK